MRFFPNTPTTPTEEPHDDVALIVSAAVEGDRDETNSHSTNKKTVVNAFLVCIEQKDANAAQLIFDLDRKKFRYYIHADKLIAQQALKEFPDTEIVAALCDEHYFIANTTHTSNSNHFRSNTLLKALKSELLEGNCAAQAFIVEQLLSDNAIDNTFFQLLWEHLGALTTNGTELRMSIGKQLSKQDQQQYHLALFIFLETLIASDNYNTKYLIAFINDLFPRNYATEILNAIAEDEHTPRGRGLLIQHAASMQQLTVTLPPPRLSITDKEETVENPVLNDSDQQPTNAEETLAAPQADLPSNSDTEDSSKHVNASTAKANQPWHPILADKKKITPLTQSTRSVSQHTSTHRITGLNHSVTSTNQQQRTAPPEPRIITGEEKRKRTRDVICLPYDEHNVRLLRDNEDHNLSTLFVFLRRYFRMHLSMEPSDHVLIQQLDQGMQQLFTAFADNMDLEQEGDFYYFYIPALTSATKQALIHLVALEDTLTSYISHRNTVRLKQIWGLVTCAIITTAVFGLTVGLSTFLASSLMISLTLYGLALLGIATAMRVRHKQCITSMTPFFNRRDTLFRILDRKPFVTAINDNCSVKRPSAD